MKFRAALVAFLMILPALAYSLTSSGPEDKPYEDAAASFSKHLDNPTTQQAFNMIQGTLLRTNIDLTVSLFLYGSPMLQAIRPMILATLGREVRRELQKGNVEMTELEEGGNNHLHQEILDVAREVLRDSGLNEEAVFKTRIFIASGDVNAYTFSGQQTERAIVLQSGLIKELTYDEIVTENGKTFPKKRIKRDLLKAVIAHENGHIKSNHVELGIQMSALLFDLISHFAGKEVVVSGAEELHLLPDKYAYSKFEADKAYTSGFLSTVALTRKALGQIALEQAEEVNRLRSQFVDTLIRVIVQNGEIDPKILQFLVSLKSAYPGSIRPDVLLKNLAPIVKLIKREWETSADMYTFNSVPRLFAAGPFLGFGGAMLTSSPADPKSYIAELVDGVRGRLKGNENMYKDATEEEIYELLGNSSGDHPNQGQRVENIVKYGQTLDVMAIQNRFLRYVVTYGALFDLAKNSKGNVAKIEAAIKQLQAALAKKDSKQGQAILAQYQEMLKSQQTNTQVAAEQAGLLLKDLISLVRNVGFKGGGLNSNRPLTDIIDFSIARKIRTLIVIEDLEKALKAAPQAKDSVEEMMTEYREQLSAGDTILKGLKMAIQDINNPFAKKIDEALDPKMTVESGRALRTAIRDELKDEVNELTYRVPVPVGNEHSDIRQSSIKADHMPPALIKKRQEELINIAEGRAPAPGSDDEDSTSFRSRSHLNLVPFISRLAQCKIKFSEIRSYVRGLH